MAHDLTSQTASLASVRKSLSTAHKSFAQIVETDTANERKLTYKATAFGKTEEPENDIIITGDCKLNHILVLHQEILCCNSSQDGRLFAIGLLGGGIRIYDPPVVSCLYVLSTKDVIKMGLPVTSVKFQPSLKQGALKNHFLASSYASGVVKFWNVESKQCIYTLEEDRQTLCMAFSRDGSTLTTAGVHGKMYVYNVETKQQLMKLEPSESRAKVSGHKSRIFSLCYHPLDFHNLISGGWDSVINIWDDRERHSVRYIAGPHICGEGIDIIPEENLVLTAAWSKKHPLQLWDFITCEMLKEVVPDTNPCFHYCGQFMKKKYIICGGSDINMVRIIDRLSYTTIASLKNMPNSIFNISHNPFFVHPKVFCVSANKIFCLDIKLREANKD